MSWEPQQFTDESIAEIATRSVESRVITHPCRRMVLACVRRSGATPLGDLAAAVAERQAGLDGSDCTDLSAETVLHHVHVPKLADAGLVTYDRETKTVHPTSAGVRVAAGLSPE